MFNVRFLMALAVTVSLSIPLITPLASERDNLAHRPARLSDSGLDQGHYDVRLQGAPHKVPPTEGQLAEMRRLQEHVEGLVVRFDSMTGTLRHAFSLSRPLTAARSGDPAVTAREFLKAHRDLFRLEDRDINDLIVAKSYRTRHNDVTHVVFKQFYQGLDVFQGDIKVNADRLGQIISVNGNYSPGLDVTLDPILSAEVAVLAAARATASDLEFVPEMKRSSSGPARETVFKRGPFSNDIKAVLTVFPALDRARLAWKVRLHLMDRFLWTDTLVDANTGELLYRHNLYKSSDPRGLVFPVNPDVGPQVARSFSGDPLASPATWVAPLPNTGTRGNNAITLPLANDQEQFFSFPFTNVYERDGLNTFDLDGQTLRFTPNEQGGYDVELLPLSFETDLGTDLTNRVRPDRDNGTLLLTFGFELPFFGTTYRAGFLNANGNITLAGASGDTSESWADMILASPRIAALWDDLDLTNVPEGGGLFVKRESGRAVVTWNHVPQAFQDDSNTIQLRMSSDGVIEIAYNGVSATDGLVGLSRGNEDFELQPVDFSSSVPVTGSSRSLAEKFPTIELDAAITNLFYQINFMHDRLYQLGFDEAAGNFQVSNFGRGGQGSDPVMSWAQHAGFNNAFFGTPEDGEEPITAYFLFTNPPFRNADSDLDADVIYHEYVHGLTTRLVGNPYDVSALSSLQSGALGEGWSDAYANSLTNDPVTGEYSTGNREIGIREVNYASSPLTYGDFGNRLGPLSQFTIGGQPLSGGIHLDRTFIPEVHQDGEVWATVMWDLFASVGKDVFEQLVTDALKFTPTNPSMLDARDAILLADVASYGGSHQAAIWTAFAARGMGVSALSDNGDDTVVFEAFDTPWNSLAPGRETIFFESFSSGISGWTVEGDDGEGGPALWHQSNRRGSAMYYGRRDTGNYNTDARNFGALTSPMIELPVISSNSALVLTFDHFLRAQGFLSLIRDNGYVRVIDAASGEVTQVACINNNTVGDLGGEFFQREEINLSRFAGRSVQIQFYFDTITAPSGDSEGWYVDNVRVSRRVR